MITGLITLTSIIFLKYDPSYICGTLILPYEIAATKYIISFVASIFF